MPDDSVDVDEDFGFSLAELDDLSRRALRRRFIIHQRLELAKVQVTVIPCEADHNKLLFLVWDAQPDKAVERIQALPEVNNVVTVKPAENPCLVHVFVAESAWG